MEGQARLGVLVLTDTNKANEPFKLDVFDFKEDRLPFLVRKGIENGDISMSRGAEILRIRHVDMRALSASWVS